MSVNVANVTGPCNSCFAWRSVNHRKPGTIPFCDDLLAVVCLFCGSAFSKIQSLHVRGWRVWAACLGGGSQQLDVHADCGEDVCAIGFGVGWGGRREC